MLWYGTRVVLQVLAFGVVLVGLLIIALPHAFVARHVAALRERFLKAPPPAAGSGPTIPAL